MSRQSTGSFMETVRTIIYAVLIAIVVRTLAYEPFNIPSGSMKPTLLVGDYLFVKKWVYGYSRYSFPFSWPPFSGRIWEAPAQRGDVVVFKWPEDNKTDYIKRIVGLPGDRIQMKAGILYINDQPVPRERIESALAGDGPGPVAKATGLGAASSSCSYAAIAIAKSLFQKGASAATALAFQFASTNLVWELGLVIWILIGWQFTLATFVGGIVMIALMGVGDPGLLFAPQCPD